MRPILTYAIETRANKNKPKHSKIDKSEKAKEHVDRMDEERLATICIKEQPTGRRSIGSPCQQKEARQTETTSQGKKMVMKILIFNKFS